MMMAMPSIAWPVWFSVVLAIETMSWKPMATARELFLVRFRYWLVIGGMMTRMAWGRMIWLQDGAGAEAERLGGFPLALGDGLDAGADDLGDVGRGVGHQTEQEGEVFGAERGAALEVEAVQGGTVQRGRVRRGRPRRRRAGRRGRRERRARRRDGYRWPLGGGGLGGSIGW